MTDLSSPLCICAGQAEAELKDFSPYYRKQFSVARFAEVEDDLEQHKEKITQLLQQRVRLNVSTGSTSLNQHSLSKNVWSESQVW